MNRDDWLKLAGSTVPVPLWVFLLALVAAFTVGVIL